MSLNLPRARADYERALHQIEQADRNSWKLTGPVYHSFQVFEQDDNANVTASATQSQGQGQLTAQYNLVATVATANDVVTLPPTSRGRKCVIYNGGACDLQIFPSSGDSIGNGAADASLILPPQSSVSMHAFDGTVWRY